MLKEMPEDAWRGMAVFILAAFVTWAPYMLIISQIPGHGIRPDDWAELIPFGMVLALIAFVVYCFSFFVFRACSPWLTGLMMAGLGHPLEPIHTEFQPMRLNGELALFGCWLLIGMFAHAIAVQVYNPRRPVQ